MKSIHLVTKRVAQKTKKFSVDSCVDIDTVTLYT